MLPSSQQYRIRRDCFPAMCVSLFLLALSPLTQQLIFATRLSNPIHLSRHRVFHPSQIQQALPAQDKGTSKRRPVTQLDAVHLRWRNLHGETVRTGLSAEEDEAAPLRHGVQLVLLAYSGHLPCLRTGGRLEWEDQFDPGLLW